MDLSNFIIGILILLLGVLIITLMKTSKDDKFIDKYGANLKIYTGAILFIVGGIILIIKAFLAH